MKTKLCNRLSYVSMLIPIIFLILSVSGCSTAVKEVLSEKIPSVSTDTSRFSVQNSIDPLYYISSDQDYVFDESKSFYLPLESGFSIHAGSGIEMSFIVQTFGINLSKKHLGRFYVGFSRPQQLSAEVVFRHAHSNIPDILYVYFFIGDQEVVFDLPLEHLSQLLSGKELNLTFAHHPSGKASLTLDSDGDVKTYTIEKELNNYPISFFAGEYFVISARSIESSRGRKRLRARIANFSIKPFSTNHPPIAVAGEDTTVEFSGFPIEVQLDGSGSSDPDGDALTYRWSGDFGQTTGVAPVITFDDLGTYEVALMVSDGNGGTAMDTVAITIQDTTAPTIEARLVPVKKSPLNIPGKKSTKSDDRPFTWIETTKLHPQHGYYRVVFSAEDLYDPGPVTKAVINGISVENGQILKLTLTSQTTTQKVTVTPHYLMLHANHFSLEVVSTDVNANSGYKSVSPAFHSTGQLNQY